ncbi:extracellular solute-binding protein [Gracilibacillus saliphilus]|uniref:extracellular solute-binding protein n=1 Tax=Gracilibacillus saliphilus TaxID=543890 RepID=UPI0013D63605|nr:extracellular solute-binding protein [Gracilibacillus saliphilus]
MHVKMMKLCIILVAISSVLLLAACGNSESKSAKGETSEKAEEGNGPLVLYANDLTDYIADMFEEATGYKMEVVHGGGGEILSRMEAEQGNPQWDVVWTGAMSSFHGFAERDFFYEGFEPENLQYMTDEGLALLPENNAYFPMSIHAAALIAYNTELIDEEEVPKNWTEFLNYKGNVAMADPAVAAPAYPVVSYIFHENGLEKTKGKFQKLFEEGRLKVFPKNGPLGQALINGDAEVAALQEHNAYELKNSGEPVDFIWPEDGAAGSVRAIGISKDTDQLEAAEAFVEFMLDPETQTALAAIDDRDSLFTPFAEGATPDPIRDPDPYIELPEIEWASEHEAEIKEWFADQAIQ